MAFDAGMDHLEQVPESETEDWTPIRIEGPLPATVAGALMQMIGNAWPEAVIKGGSRHYALDMKIPPSQSAKTVDDEFLEQMRKEVDDHGDDVTFLGFREGWVAFAPPEEMCLELGNIAHSILSRWEGDEPIVNHLEWEVKTGDEPDDPRYVLSISRSKGQTPLAMRKQAEALLEQSQDSRKRYIKAVEGVKFECSYHGEPNSNKCEGCDTARANQEQLAQAIREA